MMYSFNAYFKLQVKLYWQKISFSVILSEMKYHFIDQPIYEKRKREKQIIRSIIYIRSMHAYMHTHMHICIYIHMHADMPTRT